MFNALFTSLLQGAAFVVAALGILFIYKKTTDALTSYNDDHAIEEESNLACGLQRGALYLGVTIAMCGALTGESAGFGKDLFSFAVDGFIVAIMMIVARFINDHFILTAVDNKLAIFNNNVAVGLTEAGSYLATGVILNGAFTGEGGFMSGIVFALLGQLAMVLFFWIYSLVTKLNLNELVGDGNTAAGLLAGGILLALGIVLRASIAGDFTAWSTDLSYFGITALAAGILLGLAVIPIDRLFLPNTTVAMEITRDKNVAAITVTVSMLIAAAVIIGAAL